MPSLTTRIREQLSQPINEASFLTLGRAIHRTHKNQKLIIEDGSILAAIYNDKNPYMAITKCVQVGVSEYLVVRAINTAGKGYNVIYVLPTFALKNQFVQDRVDKSIMFTKYYQSLLRTGDKKLAESTSLKQFGEGSIIFVGSGSPVSFVSFPGDELIEDEQDQCDAENLAMAEERLARSNYRRIVKVSNPTLPKVGIDYEFVNSDQKYWHIKHECGHWVHLNFFEHIVQEIDANGKSYVLRDKDYSTELDRDIYPICDKCGKPINRLSKGEFVPANSAHHVSGYHISSIFAQMLSVKDLVNFFNEGLINDTKMQRFYNAYLGKPYIPEGSKITKDMLDECLSDHILTDKPQYPCVMGVDVGRVIHVRINEILPDETKRAIYIGEVDDVKELVFLYKQYKVRAAVIDALPETRLAKQFTHTFPGAFRCFFGSERRDMITPKDKIVTVDRTQAIDNVKEDFLLKRILLPKNAASIKDYYAHIQASTRIWDEQKQKYRWEEGGQPDHYLLSEVYANIAHKILKMVNM